MRPSCVIPERLPRHHLRPGQGLRHQGGAVRQPLQGDGRLLHSQDEALRGPSYRAARHRYTLPSCCSRLSLPPLLPLHKPTANEDMYEQRVCNCGYCSNLEKQPKSLATPITARG